MDVIAAGVDTLRTRWALDEDEALPVQREWYRDELVRRGWICRPVVEHDSKLDLVRVSNVYTWQDQVLPTRRVYLSSTGTGITTEFSVPKMLNEGRDNLDLASGPQVSMVLDGERERLRQELQVDSIEVVGFPRIDTAADVLAGPAAAGVISAGGQFRVPGRRKSSQHTYAGETSVYRWTEGCMRFYDKGRELVSKGDKEAKKTFEQWLERGRVRLECEERPKGGLTMLDVMGAKLRLAERIERGYPGGTVIVGGLDRLLQQIDTLDVGPRRKQSLVDFAVRFSHYGENGLREQLSRRTFYRRREQFLASGLCLDDLVLWQGEVDFRPVVQQLRLAAA